MLLHSDIQGYDLPAIDFVSPSKAQESHILEEQDARIFTHLEKVLIHMIDEQDAQIFKSHNDYAFFLMDRKTMQAMLAAFITTNMSGIPPSKANPISRTFPPLFTINIPEEDQIVEDLEDIEGMQTTIQAISFIVCVIVAIIILYQIFERCCYMRSIVKYCFPFFPISQILRGTHRTDLFVEVTYLMKGNTIWAHYTLTGYYPISIRLSQQILKENVCINTSWCCFKTMHIDWDNTVVTGISGIKIDMPTEAKVSIFMDNDLTHINNDHFEVNLIARLLYQIYVVLVPQPGYDYDNSRANVIEFLHLHFH